MDLFDSDSPRDVELGTLTAIYPEIRQVRPDDAYTIALDVPVTPSNGVVVVFSVTPPEHSHSASASADTAPLAQPSRGHDINDVNDPNGGPADAVDSHHLAHLPPVHLEMTFGPGYPSEEPPRISISTTPPWLPPATAKMLEDDGARLWEEIGRDMVGFTYIDTIQQSAEHVFGLVDAVRAGLKVDSRQKIALLDYDIKAKRATFELETFDCGVCLDPKKGSACHRMMDCGHVFCVECLQDFYNAAIKEGDLTSVRCPAPGCAKDRAKAAEAASGKKNRKPRTFVSPSELLQIPLDQDVVRRYVTLKYKTELESDKNTIYCPRDWCNGAARSKKHKKPQGLELAEGASDDDDENDSDGGHNAKANGATGKSKPKKTYKPAEELLAICEECTFAFCSRCFQSWHGEFVSCQPRRNKEELTAEEQASLEYLKFNTTPCPTCSALAQKTKGCNHMICFKCQTHFCYLCSAWLDPSNPYQHFNEMPGGRVTSCYMRLWELEEGDGDDVGRGFAGGGAGVDRGAPVLGRGIIFGGHDEPPDSEDDEEEQQVPRPAAVQAPHRRVRQQQQQQQQRQQLNIAREGPLVLRIAAHQQPPAVAPPAVPAAALAGGGRGAGRGGAARPRGGVAGQRGRGRGANRQNNQANHLRGGVLRRNNNPNNHDDHGPEPELARGHGPDEMADLDEMQRLAGNIQGDDVDAAQAAWIRQFVLLAMNDEEDMLLWDDQ
ncbi:RWD domain-containing protein [Lasiosphaeria miniovina]|uniref:RBR-type E3 ubiquitin transferase n=1 Tax=Lasiosphaeria miniovina TaxID=1954250 RepID=A0AA40B5R0_9PEZI|nr:RWD domain-containing protein [Lasiosphaeria miniovina]KAK0728124.1 RWD domain-containing protein [Lasiosphaeria miniovina]